MPWGASPSAVQHHQPHRIDISDDLVTASKIKGGHTRYLVPACDDKTAQQEKWLALAEETTHPAGDEETGGIMFSEAVVKSYKYQYGKTLSLTRIATDPTDPTFTLAPRSRDDLTMEELAVLVRYFKAKGTNRTLRFKLRVI